MLKDITEHQLQTFIWNNKENFQSYLEEPIFPEKVSNENPSLLTASEILYNKFVSILEDLWENVKLINLIGCEVPLKKDLDSTIRADFLGIIEGGNGIVVVELKKSSQAERQAFTEMYAYGNHLRTIFNPMSKMDINFLLISPMNERIVRESAIQNFVFDRTKFFALIPEPTIEDGKITNLKLKPWIPSLKDFKEAFDYAFSQRNFDVFKIVWEDLPGEWNPDEKGENPDEYIINRMNTMSSYAAQVMEARGIHGFVFCSQLHSELREPLPFTNSLILVGINPYKATKNRYLIKKGFSHKEANEADIDSINFLDLIPGLKNKSQKENEEHNYLSHLSMSWDNEIIAIGFDIVETLTISTERDEVTTSYGSFDWEIYQTIVLEDISCHNFDIRPTGMIRELWWEFTKADFAYIRKNGYKDHIQYSHGDFPNETIDLMNSQFHLREFIKRLYM